jgi:hypothetical protein
MSFVEKNKTLSWDEFKIYWNWVLCKTRAWGVDLYNSNKLSWAVESRFLKDSVRMWFCRAKENSLDPDGFKIYQNWVLCKTYAWEVDLSDKVILLMSKWVTKNRSKGLLGTSESIHKWECEFKSCKSSPFNWCNLYLWEHFMWRVVTK